MNDILMHCKIVKNQLVFIAFSEYKPIKFRSENRALDANLIDKTTHFGGQEKTQKSFKNQLFLANSGLENIHVHKMTNMRFRAKCATCENAKML